MEFVFIFAASIIAILIDEKSNMISCGTERQLVCKSILSVFTNSKLISLKLYCKIPYFQKLCCYHDMKRNISSKIILPSHPNSKSSMICLLEDFFKGRRNQLNGYHGLKFNPNHQFLSQQSMLQKPGSL